MTGLLDKLSNALSGGGSDPNKPSKAEFKAMEEKARQARLDALEEQARARCPSRSLWQAVLPLAEVSS